MKYLDQGTRKIITENLNSISQVSPSRASYSKKKKKKKGGGGGHEEILEEIIIKNFLNMGRK